jgi:hypothetical protein
MPVDYQTNEEQYPELVIRDLVIQKLLASPFRKSSELNICTAELTDSAFIHYILDTLKDYHQHPINVFILQGRNTLIVRGLLAEEIDKVRQRLKEIGIRSASSSDDGDTGVLTDADLEELEDEEN